MALQLPELLAAQKQQAERERLELLQTYMLQKQVYQQQVAARWVIFWFTIPGWLVVWSAGELSKSIT